MILLKLLWLQDLTKLMMQKNLMHCVYWNQSGAPMDGTIYSDDNSWKYTTEWAVYK